MGTQPKPNTGVLKYGNKTVLEDKPFWQLEAKKKELVKQGYDEKLFHKHYYYGTTNTTYRT